jgi:basic amino acid/polyamine antiporter, APA family
MTPQTRPLRKILGLGFGLALAFGTTIGVGILRLPGMVAEHLGDHTLIMAFWLIGGLYALLGAMAVAELAAMLPETGGFRVYANRAYGGGVGFAIGWCDWLQNVSSLAYVSITVVTFLGVLWPPLAAHPTALAIGIIAAFTAVHWVGLRLGSTVTSIISVAIALMMMTLVICCFVIAPEAPRPAEPLPDTAASLPLLSMAMIFAVVPALRAVLTAYDGWYSPIYMAEENTNPVKTLPRAIIGGTLLVAALYLLINLALLHALPLEVLAGSELPAADAARIMFPNGGAELVTIISIFTMLSLANNILLSSPRILFAIGRDGLLTEKAAAVSAGGTPRIALALTSIMVVVVMLSGTFEQVIAMYSVLFLLCYTSAFLALFVLRIREPDLPRPFKVFAWPLSTGIVLLGSVVFLVVAIMEDPRSGVIAGALLAACFPVYVWLERRRRAQAGVAASN